MSWQTLLVETPARMSLRYNQLQCEQDERKITLPLEDIGVVVLESHQIRISTALLSALQDSGIVVVICNAKHMPNGLLLPFHQHSRYSSVVLQQVQWSAPFKKRCWQRIVQQKIANQAACLKMAGCREHYLLESLVRSVQSGDTRNQEAYAAKLYWPRLFGRGFKRFAHASWIPAALNYGYAILRANMARAVVAVGLMPSLALHHRNQLNAYNLVDDLIEPFRPLVDSLVFKLSSKIKASESQLEEENVPELPITVKRQLAVIAQINCKINGETMSLAIGCEKVAESLQHPLSRKNYPIISRWCA